jgi:hypothetical protein
MKNKLTHLPEGLEEELVSTELSGTLNPEP